MRQQPQATSHTHMAHLPCSSAEIAHLTSIRKVQKPGSPRQTLWTLSAAARNDMKMTKDWERYRSEIERLYKSESRTLDEVQRLLRGQGFDASIRAYRMKLDEWGIRKNSSGQVRKKRRRDASASAESKSDVQVQAGTISTSHQGVSLDESAGTELNPPPLDDLEPQGPASHSENNTPDVLLKFECDLRTELEAEGFALPVGNLKCHELKQKLLLCGSQDTFFSYALEILLAKWQSDGEYLSITLDLLKDCDSQNVISFFGGNLFKVIEAKGGPRERNELTRACLKRILEDPVSLSASTFGWQRALVKVVKTWPCPWEKIQSNLQDEHLTPQVMGQAFFDCAPAVFAEHFLVELGKSVKALMENSRGEEQYNQILNARKVYMEILDHFPDAKTGLDLNGSYYRLALCMSSWVERRKDEKLQETSNFLKKSQNNYQRLEEKHSGLQEVGSESHRRPERVSRQLNWK